MASTKGKKRRSRKWSVVHPFAAGIDIGSKFHVVAVPEELDTEPVRTFSTFTNDLYRLADWLKELGILTVAMESTGVYWIPAFEILQSRGLEVVLVNARDAKTVPGRKTDVNDAQWLQQLHQYGLLRASFPDTITPSLTPSSANSYTPVSAPPPSNSSTAASASPVITALTCKAATHLPRAHARTSLAKTDLLVIDDWGMAKLNTDNLRDLLEILEDRYGIRSTIVTSQLPIDKWHELIGEPTFADAILDRLVHNAYKLKLKGGSMRKKKARLTQPDHSTT